jgi:multiple sugar transport system substrate-binding protein
MEHDMTTASTRGRRASVLTRRGLLVATGVFLAAVGAACQLSRPAPAPQRTPDPGSLLKNAHLRASTWLSGGHDAVVTSFFREFEERYPGVKIDHETGQTDERLQAQFAAATPPDLFFVGSQATSLIAGKVVAALDGYIRRDRTDIGDFFDRAVQQFRLGGLTYGLPYDFNSSVIYLNAELFRRAGLPLPPSDWKAPGWTFQDFLDAAKRLTQRTGAELQVWGYGVGPRQWAGWMAANGGWYLNAERNQLGMAEPATVEALQFAQDLIHLYRVSPALEQSQQAGGLFSLFESGRLAMYTATPADLLRHRTLSFEWDVAVHPVGRGPRATAGSGTAWALALAGVQRDAAWELCKFITSRDVQMRHMLRGMKAPVRRSVAQAPEYLNDAPPRSMAVFADAPAYALPEPQMTAWTQVSEQIQSEVLRILRNEAVPGDAMRALKSALDPLVLQSAAALKAFTGETDCGCAGK